MERDLSLDAFRGLTVIMMIIVNIQGNGELAFAALKHAEWHGLTFADVIFPWFLFIVGLSVPLALEKAKSKASMAVVMRRTVMLFLWGLFLSWLIRPVEFDQIRWLGVLQRIGVVYFGCALVCLYSRGWRVAAMLAVFGLFVHSVLLLTVVAPGEAAPSLAAGEGLNAWLDQEYLPGRLIRKTYDPEGIFSTLPAICTGFIGVSFMRWRRASQSSLPRSAASIGFGLSLIGLLGAQVLPINKQLWTASFALLTAGLGMLAWAALSSAWANIASSRLARLMVLLGQTALTLYVIHMLLIAVIVRKLSDGTRIWDLLFAKLTAVGLAPNIASLLFALIAGVICVAPLSWLKRRGWLIKT